MSAQGETNYGSKGKCFGLFIVFIILFILLWVFMINGNQNSL
jgi:hypothetical protein